MKGFTTLLAGIIFGVLATVATYSVWFEPSATIEKTSTAQKKPLYWVAPMDANYRRDKPGKSPMGMDLVPFYADGNADDGEGPGTITISPEVVNNLGVRTAFVRKDALRSQIKTVGYVRYDEDQLVHIHPRLEGWIEKLYVKASGDPVKQGQPLYDIYSPALVNAQEELVLVLTRKNERLIQAATNRLKALQMPQSAIDELIKTKKVKQFITLYAPQTGVVDNLNIREGFFVKPGTQLMSIGTLKQVWVEAHVFERQAFQVAKGQTVRMSLDFLPARQWHGKVDYVYPTLDVKTRTVKVRLRFDNPDHALKPNMFAQVNIYTDNDNDNDSLLVPKEAVIRTGSANRVVLALGEGRFKSVEVKLGRFDEHNAQILSGLKSGEKVVTSAQFLLDSESSKTSDFKRMHHRLNEQQFNEGQSSEDKATEVVAQATVNGVINAVMVNHRMLNISRGPIEKWDRPEATMDFMVGHAIDLSKLSEGMNIRFTFTIEQGEFIINEINPTSSDATTNKATAP